MTTGLGMGIDVEEKGGSEALGKRDTLPGGGEIVVSVGKGD